MASAAISGWKMGGKGCAWHLPGGGFNLRGIRDVTGHDERGSTQRLNLALHRDERITSPRQEPDSRPLAGKRLRGRAANPGGSSGDYDYLRSVWRVH